MTTTKKPAVPQPPQASPAKPPLRILKKATCPTLSEKSTLTYAVRKKPREPPQLPDGRD